MRVRPGEASLSGAQDADPHFEVFDLVLPVGSIQTKQEPFVVEASVSAEEKNVLKGFLGDDNLVKYGGCMPQNNFNWF